MTRILRSPSRVLWYESIGFLMIIGLSWLDEFEGLAQIVFGGQPHARDWRVSALQTLVIVYVWAIVWGLTRLLVQRLHYLDGLLRVCAWCRKVGHEGHWVKLEDYFAQGFQIPTTHGMCPGCLKQVQEETAEFKRKELAAGSAAAAEQRSDGTIE